MFNVEDIVERYPGILDIFSRGPWRKYELQQILECTRGEIEMIISVFTKEELLENTSQGWKLSEEGYKYE